MFQNLGGRFSALKRSANVLCRMHCTDTVYYFILFFFWLSIPLVAQGVLIVEASQSHSGTPYPVGHLWTGDQPIAETST